MSDAAPPRMGAGPALMIGAAVFTLVMLGLAGIANIFGPLFLALTLALTGRPAVVWLRKHNVPFAPFIVLAAAYLILLLMLGSLVLSGVSLATELPHYQQQFVNLYNDLVHWLESKGVTQDQIDSALAGFDVGRAISLAQALINALTSAGSQFLTMGIALAFMMIDTAALRQRGAELAAKAPFLAEALADFAWRVRRYWVVTTVFGLIVAVFNYIALLWLAVPLAFTWAVLSFVTNYIPNVGFFMALVPAALLALADGGVWKAIWVIVAFSVINVVIQTFIQPKFVGNSVGLSMTVTFVSLVFWAVVIGPLGAILAVPLTLFVRAVVIGSTPQLAWIDVFLRPSDDPNVDDGLPAHAGSLPDGAAVRDTESDGS